MEGPKIDFVGGRVDAASGGELCPPEERLPEFDETNSTMRAKFARMGPFWVVEAQCNQRISGPWLTLTLLLVQDLVIVKSWL